MARLARRPRARGKAGAPLSDVCFEPRSVRSWTGGGRPRTQNSCSCEKQHCIFVYTNMKLERVARLASVNAKYQQTKNTPPYVHTYIHTGYIGSVSPPSALSALSAEPSLTLKALSTECTVILKHCHALCTECSVPPVHLALSTDLFLCIQCTVRALCVVWARVRV